MAADPVALSHQLGLTPTEPIAAPQIVLAAQQLGLKAKTTRTTAQRLNLAALPALASMADGRFVVLAQCDGQRVLFMDPAATGTAQASRPTIEPLEVFAGQWSGELILVTSRGHRKHT